MFSIIKVPVSWKVVLSCFSTYLHFYHLHLVWKIKKSKKTRKKTQSEMLLQSSLAVFHHCRAMSGRTIFLDRVNHTLQCGARKGQRQASFPRKFLPIIKARQKLHKLRTSRQLFSQRSVILLYIFPFLNDTAQRPR